jgi:hypothetical protein
MACAMEQRIAVPMPKFVEGNANGRLTYAELASRCGDTAVLMYGDEHWQEIQIERASHGMPTIGGINIRY